MVNYRVDKIGGQARLRIVHPSNEKNPSDEKTQELIVKGGESIIVSRNGNINYSIDTKMIPIDCYGQDLDRK